VPYTLVEKVRPPERGSLSASRTRPAVLPPSPKKSSIEVVIFEEGQLADGLYVVIRGELVLTRDGKEMSRIGERSALGAWDLIEGGPRVFGTCAAAETLLLRVERQDFDDLLMDYPELGQSILKGLVRRFRRLVRPATE
jgi:CRP-like cAMP-binding protein